MDKTLLNRVNWQMHKGEKYLFYDFSDLDSREIFEVSLNTIEIIRKENDKSVITLVDTTNAEMSFNTILTLRRFSKESQQYIKKSAIVINNEDITFLFNTYKNFTNSKAVLFKTKEQALAYLFPSS